MAKPGVVLRRPVGSNGAFSEHARLPKHLPYGDAQGPSAFNGGRQAKQPSNYAINNDAARKAALAYAQEQ